MDNSNQPQTPEQPQAPQPPVAGGPSYQMPQPSAPAPVNKKVVMWIGIAAGALLLIGVVVAIIVGLTSVSKEDYRKAYS